MRIYEMTATFGKLENQTLKLQAGLNLLEAPNEWGKSTWCAFLSAMFYGLDTRAKTTKTALADKERYAPWSGSPMSGRIRLHWQGRDITIERYTRGRIPMGEFRAYETETGLPVPELNGANCGQILLGAEQSVFRRAGFVRLSDMPVTQDDALRRRLNALVTTGDESGDGEKLARELKELKNRIRYNRTGLLPQAEAELETLETTLSELEGLQRQSKTLQQRQGELQSWLRELENHSDALHYTASETGALRVAEARDVRDQAQQALSRLEHDCADLPSRQEAEETCRKLGQLGTQWESAQMELQFLPEEPRMPEIAEPFRDMTGEEALEQVNRDICGFEEVRDPGVLRPYWILAGLAALGGVALFALADWPYGVIALFVGMLMLGLGIRKRHIQTEKAREYEWKYGSADTALWLTLAQRHETALRNYQVGLVGWKGAHEELDGRLAELQEQIRALCADKPLRQATEHWQEILHKWEAYDLQRRETMRAESALQTLQSLLKPAPKPGMEDNLTYSEGETDQLIFDARKEQQRLLERLGQVRGRMEALGDREALLRRRESLKERIRKLEDTYTALTLGLDTLSEASRELQRRFAPRISRRSRELLGRMTAGRYDRLTLSEDFSLLTGAGEETTLQSALWRSDGTVDQLYLSLRLAVAEALTPHAPLVLDDALVRFDDERLKAVLEILRELSENRQILLFTCQSRERNLLETL